MRAVNNGGVDIPWDRLGGKILLIDQGGPTPLSALHPDFAATFAGSGSLAEGGNLLVVTGDDGNKGIVGALLEFSELGFAISTLNAVATFHEASYP